MSDHEHFQFLSALAAAGDLSAEEKNDFLHHLSECSVCRESYDDYVRVVQQIRLDNNQSSQQTFILRRSQQQMLRRSFLARAESEGIQFSHEVSKKRLLDHVLPVWEWQSVLAVAAMVIVIAWGSTRLSRGWRSLRDSNANTAQATLVRQPPGQSDKPVGQTDAPDSPLAQNESYIGNQGSNETKRRLRQAQVSEMAIEKLQQQLQQSRSEADQMLGDLRDTSERNANLEHLREQEKDEIAGLRKQIEELLRKQDDDVRSLNAQNERIQGLASSLEQARANLERERQLSEVSQDVHEIMGARNLHIIDVQDVNNHSKSAKAFGRVFYAEGQFLIFYAFDLPDASPSPARYRFQAWGQREEGSLVLRNLGTLEIDNSEQRRWVLSVNDPALLAGIDSVFVTAESKDSREPQGDKLLYAYLAGRPNHM